MNVARAPQLESEKIGIFAGKFFTSAARRLFYQLFRFSGRFGDSISRRRKLWPGIEIFAGKGDL
jgi:hypothetical protein